VTAPTGSYLTEDAAFGGHENAYTVSKREAERIVTGSGLDAVVVRPTIVLSRGVDDRAMARSILWSIPIMNEIGDVPVDPGAYVDVVPVDFVAAAIVRLATSAWLKYRIYHISAGRDSHTFAELLNEIVRFNPEYSRIRLSGIDGPRPRRSRRLFGPIDAYLPFINGSIQYSNDRLQQELGPAGRAGASISYISELLKLINLTEALTEMAKP
jgi:nucleoside-diphosphate-sugar epimerase